MPMTFDAIQYRDSPLGRVKEKNAIISGINQSIIIWLVDCRGSVEGVIVIFCWSQVETKTSTGITTLVGSGSDRSIHRNDAPNGAAVYIGKKGIQAYHFSASATRLSGRE